MHKKSFAFQVCYLSLVLLFISCSHDSPVMVYEQGTNENVNQWMYQQMKRYYYWNETMPNEGDLSIDPKEYFSKLLQPTDRFSYTLHLSKAETFPQSVRGNFGFDVAFIEHGGKVYGVVLYVLADSPASRSILKRGMLITSMNGTALNQSNYDGLYQEISSANQLHLQLVEYNGTDFSTPISLSISRGITLLQPLFKKVISQNNNKVGYLAIPHFDVGLAPSLLQAFTEFKNQSITQLVLDLRYNGGGDIASATALSILVAPTIQANDPFITFKGNKNGGTINQSFKQALEMNETKLSYESLRNSHPSVQKVYILCGNHTASASEIIINNLKPYMEVICIGEKTVGKDVAGFPIQDDRNPTEQGWVLYPSIYKLFNANNEGGYNAGIIPTIEVSELQQLPVLPLGDPNEVLLKEALSTITSSGRTSRVQTIRVLKKTIKSEQDPLFQITP
ncbi:S41 family peptidase [Flavobacterium sp.]|uniref:S41 family peptidase n=1 Tax=Flavobacterium sp. TaxID=239 RepID=UPI003C4A3937